MARRSGPRPGAPARRWSRVRPVFLVLLASSWRWLHGWLRVGQALARSSPGCPRTPADGRRHRPRILQSAAESPVRQCVVQPNSVDHAFPRRVRRRRYWERLWIALRLGQWPATVRAFRAAASIALPAYASLSYDYTVHNELERNRAELMTTFANTPPQVIAIDTPWLRRARTLDFPELTALIARDYELDNEPSNPIFAGWQIYRRRPGQPRA